MTVRSAALGAILFLLTGCSIVPSNPFPRDIDATTGSYQPRVRSTGLRAPPPVLALTLRGTPRLEAPRGWTRPPWVNNAGYFVPVQDQGETPMCTAYAMEYILKAAYWRQYGVWPAHNLHTPLYTESKRLEGDNEPGTSFESMFQACTNIPLLVGRFNIMVSRVESGDDVAYAIHQTGTVLSALEITDAWWNYRGGIMAIRNGNGCLHAQVVVGYDDNRRTVYGLNSWGADWGNQGFWTQSTGEFRLEYKYGYAVRVRFTE